MDGDGRSSSQQVVDDPQRWALAHVVGVGLEGQAPHGDAGTDEVQVFGEATDRSLPDSVIDGESGVEHGGGDPVVARLPGERGDVLGETGPAEAEPRLQERRTNPRVGRQHVADPLDVGTRGVADRRKLVHHADPTGEHAVGGILGQLRRAHVHVQQRDALVGERPVEPVQDRSGDGARGPDDQTVGVQDVADRAALAQELRVRGHVDDGADAATGQRQADASIDGLPRAHRDGALGHQDDRLAQQGTDLVGCREDVAQVGPPIRPHRGGHREEDDVRAWQGVGELARETQPGGRPRFGEQGVQSRLVDHRLAPREAGDPLAVGVDEGDRCAQLSQPGRGDQADVAGPDDGDPHRLRQVHRVLRHVLDRQ